jgi:hypothetical protein
MTEYDLNGNNKKEEIFNLEKGFLPINIHETKLDSAKKIFTGNFSCRDLTWDVTIGAPKVSKVDGIYFAKKNGEEKVFSRMYSFWELKSFWDYISPFNFDKKELKKLEDRDTTDKSSKLISDYYLLSHDVVKINDTYVLIGEIYVVVSQLNGGVIENGGIGNDGISHGFRYLCTINCGFDMEGNLLWDNTFKISNHLYDKINYRVKPELQNNELVVYSIGDSAISKKKLILNEFKEAGLPTRLDNGLKYPVQRLSIYNAEMVFWYDNYVLIWGEQFFAPDEKVFKKRIDRSIIYFTKLQYSD